MPYNSTVSGDTFRLQVNATYVYRLLREHGGLTFVFKDLAAADRWAEYIEERVAWYFRLQVDLAIPAAVAKKELDATGTFYSMCRKETLAYFEERPEDLNASIGMRVGPVGWR